MGLGTTGVLTQGEISRCCGVNLPQRYQFQTERPHPVCWTHRDRVSQLCTRQIPIITDLMRGIGSTSEGKVGVWASLAFLHDLLPQRVHQDWVRVSRTVDDGQLALRQFEMVRKLPVELRQKTHVAHLRILSFSLLISPTANGSTAARYLGDVHEL